MAANPRVWKEANALFRAGYDVTIRTTFYDAAKLKQDIELLDAGIKYTASVNLIKGQGSFGDRIVSRAWRKIFFTVKKFTGRDSKHLLAYSPSKQVKKAFSEHADLYIAHQETGLIIGYELLKKGKKVAFDFEDWYSRDYLTQLRPVELLRNYESKALEAGWYITCPSHAMSKALQLAYNTLKAPAVIYNGFSINETKALGFIQKQRGTMVWTSQVIGPGRGLEKLLTCLREVRVGLELHLVGASDILYQKTLQTLLSGTEHRIFFHAPRPHAELLSFISRFEIGLALENAYPDNKDLTISNKILQYLQAGLKILATSTQGQAEVADACRGCVGLLDIHTTENWAAVIEELLQVQDDNAQKNIPVFERVFSWEAQEKNLLTLIESGITSGMADQIAEVYAAT